jgi:hypothetical protein
MAVAVVAVVAVDLYQVVEETWVLVVLAALLLVALADAAKELKTTVMEDIFIVVRRRERLAPLEVEVAVEAEVLGLLPTRQVAQEE